VRSLRLFPFFSAGLLALLVPLALACGRSDLVDVLLVQPQPNPVSDASLVGDDGSALPDVTTQPPHDAESTADAEPLPDAAPPLDAGPTIDGAVRACSSETCASGCCYGDICAQGNQDIACGTRGFACLDCTTSGAVCLLGDCAHPR
jgi:hypothetical protein